VILDTNALSDVADGVEAAVDRRLEQFK